MKIPYSVLVLLTLFSLVPGIGAEASALPRREWNVNGVTREALVHVPANATTTSAPLVFVYHGHNGTMQAISRTYKFHEIWPEAIVVYPQGLNTTSSRDPEGKQAGWQRRPAQDSDRDLALFDIILASLKSDYQVDPKRIYATGHSNGGAFTYLLWATRGDALAALASVGTVVLLSPEEASTKLSPKPIFHVAGTKDEIVAFANQKSTIDLIRAVNQCRDGEPGGMEHCTLYPSKLGTPLIAYIHPGAHGFPRPASAAIRDFFKAHTAR